MSDMSNDNRSSEPEGHQSSLKRLARRLRGGQKDGEVPPENEGSESTTEVNPMTRPMTQPSSQLVQQSNRGDQEASVNGIEQNQWHGHNGEQRSDGADISRGFGDRALPPIPPKEQTTLPPTIGLSTRLQERTGTNITSPPLSDGGVMGCASAPGFQLPIIPSATNPPTGPLIPTTDQPSHAELSAQYKECEKKMHEYWKWYEDEKKKREALETSQRTFDDDLFNIRETLKQKEDNLASAMVSKSSLEKDIASLQTALSTLQTNYERVYKDASQLTTDLRESRALTNNVTNELLQLKSELKSNYDDTWFIRQWTDLHAKIQNITTRCFVGKLVRPAGPVATRARGTVLEKPKAKVYPPKMLAVLSKDCTRYTSSETHRPLIIQAFVWWMLNAKVFDHVSRHSEGLHWAGPMRDALSAMKGQLRPLRLKDWSRLDEKDFKRHEKEGRLYHKWRATSSMLLLEKIPPSHEAVNDSTMYEILNSIMEVISPYIVSEYEAQRAARESDLRIALDQIITLAINLDAQMSQQRAYIFSEHWTLHGVEGSPLWGFRWAEEEMQSLPGPNSKGGRKHYYDPCVEMIVQPGLYREGDQYGEKYSERRVLCKAKVVLCENPTY